MSGTREGIAPFRNTKPSEMGVTLTMLFPISITREVPFPDAKLTIGEYVKLAHQ